MAVDDKVFKAEAWTVAAVVEAGVPDEMARKALVDGPRAEPMRARVSLHGRVRTEPTRHYVWGPDLAFVMGRA
jgi:hypothetical protein